MNALSIKMNSLLKIVPVPLRARLPLSRRYTRANAWQQFATEYRGEGKKLLRGLPLFDDPILIAGCQRSGGTMLTDIICRHTSMMNYCENGDRELAGAWMLARPESVPKGRYCFQTTYLNEHYREYFEHGHFRLVWIIRRPVSVVHSMLQNWSRYALEELYKGSLSQFADDLPEHSTKTPLDKACFAYTAKCAQLAELHDRLGKRIWVIDYDEFVQAPQRQFPALLDFLNLSPEATESLANTGSLEKANRTKPTDRALIETRCQSDYEHARLLLSTQPATL